MTNSFFESPGLFPASALEVGRGFAARWFVEDSPRPSFALAAQDLPASNHGMADWIRWTRELYQQGIDMMLLKFVPGLKGPVREARYNAVLPDSPNLYLGS